MKRATMRRAQSHRAAMAIVLLLAAWTPADTASAQDATETALEVKIVHPPAGQALFGTQEIRVAVRSPEPLERLTIEVDGSVVATLEAPPYVATADFGDENRDHVIVAVATTRSGASGRARVLAPAIVIDDELDLGLNQLYVTATGRRKARILDLEAEDFSLTDDGVAQEVVTFERGDIPFTAILMLDGSQSMVGQRLEAALAGARAFVAGMRTFDKARLLVVADRLLEASPFVNRGEPLAKALVGTAATGGTALYDYLFLALKSLERRQGRRVIVLLSDGSDVHSTIPMDGLRQTLKRSATLVYWLRLRETGGQHELVSRTSWRHPRQAERDLAQLGQSVLDTGGRIVDVAGPKEMGPALQEILAELREQYAIGYYPQPRRGDSSTRRVMVKTGRSGVKLRYRPEYVDR